MQCILWQAHVFEGWLVYYNIWQLALWANSISSMAQEKIKVFTSGSGITWWLQGVPKYCSSFAQLLWRRSQIPRNRVKMFFLAQTKSWSPIDAIIEVPRLSTETKTSGFEAWSNHSFGLSCSTSRKLHVRFTQSRYHHLTWSLLCS